jgi:hypothetical protein
MIGMSLLVCDTSFDFLVSNVMYHSKKVDLIICTANNPSKLLLKMIELLENSVSNFKFFRSVYEPISLDLQVSMVNSMVEELIKKGCKWVVNCDDDEFYLGDIRESIFKAEQNNCNVLYQDGFCFHSTIHDNQNLNPVRRMVYRDSENVDYNFRKAIHRTENFYSVTPGNHWVMFYGDQYKEMKDPTLLIYHYSYRKKYLYPHYKDTFKLKTDQEISELQLVKDETLIHVFDSEGIP